MSNPSDGISKDHVQQLVRERLQQHVEGFPSQLGDNEDLQLAGVRSLDLLVVLSGLEQELNIALEDVFVAKGYTIGGIASRIVAAYAASNGAGGSTAEASHV